MESNEKGVHDRMGWVDGSGTSKRSHDGPRHHRFLVPGGIIGRGKALPEGIEGIEGLMI